MKKVKIKTLTLLAFVLILGSEAQTISALTGACYPVKPWIPVYLTIGTPSIKPLGDKVSVTMLNYIWTLHPMITRAINFPSVAYEYNLYMKLEGQWHKIDHGVHSLGASWDITPVTFVWGFHSLLVSIDLLGVDFKYTMKLRPRPSHHHPDFVGEIGHDCYRDAEYKLPVEAEIIFSIDRETGKITRKSPEMTNPIKTTLEYWARRIESNLASSIIALRSSVTKKEKGRDRPKKWIRKKMPFTWRVGGIVVKGYYRKKVLNPKWIEWKNKDSGSGSR